MLKKMLLIALSYPAGLVQAMENIGYSLAGDSPFTMSVSRPGNQTAAYTSPDPNTPIPEVEPTREAYVDFIKRGLYKTLLQEIQDWEKRPGNRAPFMKYAHMREEGTGDTFLHVIVKKVVAGEEQDIQGALSVFAAIVVYKRKHMPFEESVKIDIRNNDGETVADLIREHNLVAFGEKLKALRGIDVFAAPQKNEEKEEAQVHEAAEDVDAPAALAGNGALDSGPVIERPSAVPPAGNAGNNLPKSPEPVSKSKVVTQTGGSKWTSGKIGLGVGGIFTLVIGKRYFDYLQEKKRINRSKPIEKA